jgi:ribosomal protein S27AE
MGGVCERSGEADEFRAAGRVEPVRVDVAVFTCPSCGRSSSHPDDIAEQYCGACHRFTVERGYPER